MKKQNKTKTTTTITTTTKQKKQKKLVKFLLIFFSQIQGNVTHSHQSEVFTVMEISFGTILTVNKQKRCLLDELHLGKKD